MTHRPFDGYHRREVPAPDPELTEVGPGTPGGEYLRRFWQPVAFARDLAETPLRVRILGEDLVVFRDRGGRVGVLHLHCAHRGTSLEYGIPLERGLRCCYHGWVFDVDGRCLETPGEPAGSRLHERVGQGAYPTHEFTGLIFAYLGPPERRPVLPRWEPLEVLDAGEFLEADASSIGGGGPVVIPCNWLQHYENLMDTLHVPILHGAFSGVQFTEAMGLTPEVTWAYSDKGVTAISHRRLPDGRIFHRISEAVLPTLRVIPNPRVEGYGRVETIGWVLPIDDTHFRIYTAGRVRSSGDMVRVRSRLNGKLWEELTEAEHQRFPGDYEAQVGQGPITLHSEEHLVSSDRGVSMVRRLLRRQLTALAQGRDPIGVRFDDDAAPTPLDAGNFLVEGAASRPR